MWRCSLFLLLVFFSDGVLGAEQIYGNLRENGRGINGAKIQVALGGKAYSTITAPDGSYRLYIRESGRCSFRVSVGGRIASTEIFSSAGPIKYDFDLVNENGKYILRRR